VHISIHSHFKIIFFNFVKLSCFCERF
jgi:hypothetical protein